MSMKIFPLSEWWVWLSQKAQEMIRDELISDLSTAVMWTSVNNLLSDLGWCEESRSFWGLWLRLARFSSLNTTSYLVMILSKQSKDHLLVSYKNIMYNTTWIRVPQASDNPFSLNLSPDEHPNSLALRCFTSVCSILFNTPESLISRCFSTKHIFIIDRSYWVQW